MDNRGLAVDMQRHFAIAFVQILNFAIKRVSLPHDFQEPESGELRMANRAGKTKRVPWSKADDRTLKAHSKRKTPVVKISKEMKRTIGALRQRAFMLELPLGHRR